MCTNHIIHDEPAAAQSEPDDATCALLFDSLRRMRLIAADETLQLTLLTGGVSSLIARATCGGRVCCIKVALPQLNVAAEWKAPVERNLAEVDWIKLVAGIAPSAVPRIHGEDPQQHAFAMEYFEPQRFSVWKRLLLDGVAQPDIAANLAAILSTIHAATARKPHIARAFANMDSFEELRLDPYLGQTARAHPDLADTLGALRERTRATQLVLVHGDVSPKNVLICEQRVVLLDAECACYGDPAFDVAFCLTHLLLKAMHRPSHADGYLQCARTLVGTYLRGVDWEPAVELQRRTATLLPALLLARIDGKSPVEYLDEPARARVRQRSRALLISPMQQLSQLLDFWVA